MLFHFNVSNISLHIPIKASVTHRSLLLQDYTNFIHKYRVYWNADKLETFGGFDTSLENIGLNSFESN